MTKAAQTLLYAEVPADSERKPHHDQRLAGSEESLTWLVDLRGVIWCDCLCHLSEHMLQGMN